MDSINRFMQAIELLPDGVRKVLEKMSGYEQKLIQEIRFRVNKPLSIVLQGENYFLSSEGRAFLFPSKQNFIITADVIQDVFLRLCSYSVHTHQEELARGYITTKNGDRAGIAAVAVQKSDGVTSTYRDITSINLRIAREVVGVSECLKDRISPKEGVLIAGMPSSGKTTLLRDLARALADGDWQSCYRVVVIDERYELSATYRGVEGFHLGAACDVISGQKKGIAIEQAIRVLSPQIIVCDEIGSMEEIGQLQVGIASGVAFIASVHCGSKEDLLTSKKIKALIDTGAFSSIVLLGTPKQPCVPAAIMSVGEFYDKAHGLNMYF